MVDDPYDWGAIAAANALSDIYAMGGRPFLALNLAAFPATLPEEIIARVLLGSAEKVREAGAIVAGGHTIDDEEPKFGLAVLGMTSPEQISTKAGAQPGDVLVLTKPLGVGIITTAYKGDVAAPEHVAAAVASMKQLNRAAAEALAGSGPMLSPISPALACGLPTRWLSRAACVCVCSGARSLYRAPGLCAGPALSRHGQQEHERLVPRCALTTGWSMRTVCCSFAPRRRGGYS